MLSPIWRSSIKFQMVISGILKPQGEEVSQSGGEGKVALEDGSLGPKCCGKGLAIPALP